MTPSSPPERRTNGIRATLTIADTASWYCSIIVVALILFITFREENFNPYGYDDNIHNGGDNDDHHPYFSSLDIKNNVKEMMKGTNFHDQHRPCDEIYVVGDGETLHTISDKCGDPYIVERNPHIHDPDDVFPGLVIKIMPSPSINNINRKFLR